MERETADFIEELALQNDTMPWNFGGDRHIHFYKGVLTTAQALLEDPKLISFAPDELCTGEKHVSVVQPGSLKIEQLPVMDSVEPIYHFHVYQGVLDPSGKHVFKCHRENNPCLTSEDFEKQEKLLYIPPFKKIQTIRQPQAIPLPSPVHKEVILEENDQVQCEEQLRNSMNISFLDQKAANDQVIDMMEQARLLKEAKQAKQAAIEQEAERNRDSDYEPEEPSKKKAKKYTQRGRPSHRDWVQRYQKDKIGDIKPVQNQRKANTLLRNGKKFLQEQESENSDTDYNYTLKEVQEEIQRRKNQNYSDNFKQLIQNQAQQPLCDWDRYDWPLIESRSYWRSRLHEAIDTWPLGRYHQYDPNHASLFEQAFEHYLSNRRALFKKLRMDFYKTRFPRLREHQISHNIHRYGLRDISMQAFKTALINCQNYVLWLGHRSPLEHWECLQDPLLYKSLCMQAIQQWEKEINDLFKHERLNGIYINDLKLGYLKRLSYLYYRLYSLNPGHQFTRNHSKSFFRFYTIPKFDQFESSEEDRRYTKSRPTEDVRPEALQLQRPQCQGDRLGKQYFDLLKLCQTRAELKKKEHSKMKNE